MNSYNSDQLSKISDEDLHREFLSVRAEINKAKKRKSRSLELEIYYCYVTREIKIREEHKKFMQQNKK